MKDEEHGQKTLGYKTQTKLEQTAWTETRIKTWAKTRVKLWTKTQTNSDNLR